MAEGTGVTLPGIGIFIHSSVKGRNRESMLQHEYGHFLDYKLSFDLYNTSTPTIPNIPILNFYLQIGIPSILNLTPGFNKIPGLDGRHKDFYTEKRADWWSKVFFGDMWLGN
ncbi:hypothetical protein [Algoriphagus algorifonticola]|uniref:hypothetical protein n=1 Tax=Algoriphagus algorifonticola TaxID=2593007 RepID=UPI0011A90B7C|nr:hypothetical protein [Algoriphagus algorifonticola]